MPQYLGPYTNTGNRYTHINMPQELGLYTNTGNRYTRSLVHVIRCWPDVLSVSAASNGGKKSVLLVSLSVCALSRRRDYNNNNKKLSFRFDLYEHLESLVIYSHTPPRINMTVDGGLIWARQDLQ